jgi:hypothetical protein
VRRVLKGRLSLKGSRPFLPWAILGEKDGPIVYVRFNVIHGVKQTPVDGLQKEPDEQQMPSPPMLAEQHIMPEQHASPMILQGAPSAIHDGGGVVVVVVVLVVVVVVVLVVVVVVEDEQV